MCVRANVSRVKKFVALFFLAHRRHLHSTAPRSRDSNLSSANLERQPREINSFSFRARIYTRRIISYSLRTLTEIDIARASRNNASKKKMHTLLRCDALARPSASIYVKSVKKEFASKSSYRPSLLLSFFLPFSFVAFTSRAFSSIRTCNLPM